MEYDNNRDDEDEGDVEFPDDDELTEVLNKLHYPSLPSNKVGFYAYSDAPPGIGGGNGTFYWFDIVEEMLGFIGRYMTWVNPGPISDDQLAVDARVNEIVSSAEAHDFSWLMENLNKALENYSQFTFMGCSDDVFHTDNEFIKEMRESFLSDVLDLEEPASDVIHPDDPVAEEFREYCQTYGMS